MDMIAAHRNGVTNARNAGWSVLTRGGTALEAVEAAVTVLEDDDTFDAGRGSFLTSDGHVQLDALMMDGATLRAGGVGCVERLRNPVQAARLVLEKSPHVYFVGPGAEEFVHSLGMPLIDNSELVIDRERERLRHAQMRAAAGLNDSTFSGELGNETDIPAEFSSHDTVGAIALDVHGNLAAATSTGGTLNKTPGRVGDSSLIGCGCYADNDSAATSLTGWGEPIMKLVLGKWACDRVHFDSGSGSQPQAAATAAIEYLARRLNGHGGIILLDRKGRFGLAHNTPKMAWALATAQHQAAGCHRDELIAMDLQSSPE
jgi:beta-aspartyl-peptidase (threonine type)